MASKTNKQTTTSSHSHARGRMVWCTWGF